MSRLTHHNPAGLGRRLLLGALAVLVSADIVTDSLVRLSGHSPTAWMDGLESFAVLVLVVGMAVLMWQFRSHASEPAAAAPPSGQVHDGGAGVKAGTAMATRRGDIMAPRLQDGGSFHSLRRP